MSEKFPPAKGPKVPPMQPRITINIGESASSAQLRRLIRDRHAAWSQETFGDVGPIGPLKHLAKEALEAAAAPDDTSEWADLQFLLWDAQRRAGISDGEITAAMEEKLKVNMARQWPEPKDGEPRLHIKEPGNSPAIPDTWIKCGERMPEAYESVIFWVVDNIPNDVLEGAYNGYWDGENWSQCTALTDYGVFDCDLGFIYRCIEPGNKKDPSILRHGAVVSHWMPLPAAPNLGDE
ncbi:DUF550 domain-containing protein [Citrobacter freundii]|nr:DUF550 domain-containing protein [Citrobacter freundii]